MSRQLCQLGVIWCVIYWVMSLSHDLRQADSSGNTSSCSGPLSRFAGRRRLFTDGARVLFLRKGKNGPGTFQCFVYDDSEGIGSRERYKTKRRRDRILTCTQKELSSLIPQCNERLEKVSSRWILGGELKRGLVFPGTVWCGAGNKANGDITKLGDYNETDSCCRAHDLCGPQIAGRQTDPTTGLKNDYRFTRLHCKCDRDFKACLKQSSDDLADDIGAFYFNVLPAKCFDVESRCKNSGGGRNTSGSCKWKWLSLGGY